MNTVKNLFLTLREELETYLEPAQIDVIQQAYELAAKAHKGQFRQTGEPYISHPLAVAHILAGMRMDAESIIVALLHDVLEDTGLPKETLIKKFGEGVTELVEGVSKLTQMQFETRAEAQAENFRKMVLAMVRDIRIILIKLADRLHNMRTLQSLNPEKRHRIARETLEIYAPIANRLGMQNFRVELEDLSFAALYPMRYRILHDAVHKLRAEGSHKEMLMTIKTAIKDGLQEHHLSPSAVTGRHKHLYSIYRKMRQKHLSLSEIMDVYGFRIVVDHIDTCYRVLGAVHNLYKPVPERFKDYIAIPKLNGYQSLHTTLFGPKGVPIEVQIRTAEMEYLANYGIAAHWLYKSTTEGGQQPTSAEIRAQEWLQGLLELQNYAGNSVEFIEHVKVDLFPDELYVFTPAGAIVELPSGATPVDFAYAVHSDIGNTCVAVKLDKRLAPLSTPLVNGQTVEIITAPGAVPNPAWLNFVVTVKARSNIRHFLKNQRRTEAIALGRKLLSNVLTPLGATWEQLPPVRIRSVLKALHYKTVPELFEAVGLGRETAFVVTSRLTKMPLEQVSARLSDPLADRAANLTLALKGAKGVVISFAECCRPIPGDPIVGLVDAGQGIVVHMEQCPQIMHVEQSIPVRWDDKVQGMFKVDIVIEAQNQPGILSKVAQAIASTGANIDNVMMREQLDHYYSMVHLTLSVRNRGHLAQVIRRVRVIKEVIRIGREK